MKTLASVLGGVALGWAMKTGGSDAWVAVGCAAATGFLVCAILVVAEFVTANLTREHEEKARHVEARDL